MTVVAGPIQKTFPPQPGALQADLARAALGAPGANRSVPVTPPRDRPALSLLLPMEGTVERLLEIDQRRYASRPELSFGLESRATFRLSSATTETAELNPRTFWLRPPAEPATFSYWRRFQDWTVEDSSAIELAGCLAGKAQGYRTAPSASLPDGDGVRRTYPDADQACDWLRSLPKPERGCSTLDGLASAFHAFATLVLNHPFPDGNGRFGRALFQGVLARTLDLTCPMLPLGPFTYVRGRAVVAGWIALGVRHDWGELTRTYALVLRDVLDFHTADPNPQTGGK